MGYKCLDPTRKVLISRNVIFDEPSFPFAKKDTYENLLIVEHTREAISSVPIKISCNSPTIAESPTQLIPPMSSNEHVASNPSSEPDAMVSSTDDQPVNHPIIPLNT